MNVTRRRLLGALAAAPFAWPRRAGGQSTPSPAGSGDNNAITTPGRHPLIFERDRDGVVYLPRGYQPSRELPLMLVLHGAGGSSASADGWFPLADEHGVILLAPDSRQWTWDSLLGGFGPDVDFLFRALKWTVERVAVDRRRLALSGFSDGASYALSPAVVAGKPRIFISHGTDDRVMPIDETSRRFVPRLRALNYDVTYREFDGRHTLPPDVRREALTWFLAGRADGD